MSLSVVTMPAALWVASSYEEYARGESWTLPRLPLLSLAQHLASSLPLLGCEAPPRNRNPWPWRLPPSAALPWSPRM